jgi:uncharacterized membrane protein (Fun14 family)
MWKKHPLFGRNERTRWKMIGESTFQLGLEVGSGGILGAITGFTVKKVMKIVAFFVGLFAALLYALELEGVLSVKWGVVRRMLETTEFGMQIPEILLNVLGGLPVGGGFAAGAFFGYKKG